MNSDKPNQLESPLLKPHTSQSVTSPKEDVYRTYLQQEANNQSLRYADDTLKYGPFLKCFCYYILYIFFIGPLAFVVMVFTEKRPDLIARKLHLFRWSWVCVNNLFLAFLNMAILYEFSDLMYKLSFAYPIILLYIFFMLVDVLFLTHTETKIFNETKKDMASKYDALEKALYSKQKKEDDELFEPEWLDAKIENDMKLTLISKKTFKLEIGVPLGHQLKNEPHMVRSLKASKSSLFEGFSLFEVSGEVLFKNIILFQLGPNRKDKNKWILFNVLYWILIILAAVGSLIILLNTPFNDSNLSDRKYIGIILGALFKIYYVWLLAIKILIFSHMTATLIEKMNIFKKLSALVDETKPKAAKLNIASRGTLNSYITMLNLMYNFCKSELKKTEFLMIFLAVGVIFNLGLYYADRFKLIVLGLDDYQILFSLMVSLDVFMFVVIMGMCVLVTNGYNSNYSSIRRSLERLARVLRDIEINHAEFKLNKPYENLDGSRGRAEDFDLFREEASSTMSSENLQIVAPQTSDAELNEEEYYHFMLVRFLRYSYIDEGLRIENSIPKLTEDINSMMLTIDRQKRLHCVKFLGLTIQPSFFLKLAAIAIPLTVDVSLKTFQKFINKT